MKTLGKLIINPEKVIKNEELVNLRGGYGSGTCAWEGSSEYAGQCNVTRYEAEYWSNTYGGHWCCDSCGSATWYEALCG